MAKEIPLEIRQFIYKCQDEGKTGAETHRALLANKIKISSKSVLNIFKETRKTDVPLLENIMLPSFSEGVSFYEPEEICYDDPFTKEKKEEAPLTKETQDVDMKQCIEELKKNIQMESQKISNLFTQEIMKEKE